MVKRRRLCVVLAATALLGGCANGDDGNEEPTRVAKASTSSGITLFPLPKAAAATCRSVQRRTTANVLCPAFLPRPAIGWPQRARLPKLRTERFQIGKTLIGIEFAYGAPVEPTEGIRSEWVRQNLWRNRPCCSFHFTIEWDFEGRIGRIPPAARPSTSGGKAGRLLPATGYAFLSRDGSRGPFWANHTWFFWSERGTTYAASVHFFGRPGTQRLLGEIVARLQAADRL